MLLFFKKPRSFKRLREKAYGIPKDTMEYDFQIVQKQFKNA